MTDNKNSTLSPTEFLAKKYFDQGEKYFTGDGVPVDFKKAVTNYEQSAKFDYTPAVFSLGV